MHVNNEVTYFVTTPVVMPLVVCVAQQLLALGCCYRSARRSLLAFQGNRGCLPACFVDCVYYGAFQRLEMERIRADSGCRRECGLRVKHQTC